ncbi:hypothetical protein SK803_16910 [Lentzea sp. BCCO 10_0856]|uniref:Helix-turn-helix domain-containing protein n=1 Tax=Lentzea miocenica TaxID=3095431 RepID=A0ABU4T171_9PSEU|nr:hypothetical protein [Lentzea sp. BCCO 10_0856]MDX8031907.1 hypothetical protein [Lentzea sp. BCCO 10_0856]
MDRNSRGADAHPAAWPDPAGMRTTAEFLCGLKKVRTRSGRSFTELAEHSRELGYPLARSTLHKLCSEENRKLPATFVRVEHFLLTCGVPAGQVESWRQTYHRLSETAQALVPDAVVKGVGVMPVGEVGDYVPDFTAFDRPAGVRPSLTWLVPTFLVGTAVGGALMAWLG